MESNHDSQPSPPSISKSSILYVIIEVTPKSSNTYANVWIHPNQKLETKLSQDGSVIGLTMMENFRFTVDAGFLDDEDSAVGIEVFRSCLGFKNKLCRRKLLERVLCPVRGARDSPRLQQYKVAGGGMVKVVIGVREEGFTKIGAAGEMKWAMSDYAMDGAGKGAKHNFSACFSPGMI